MTSRQNRIAALASAVAIGALAAPFVAVTAQAQEADAPATGTIVMWGRAQNDAFNQRLVDAYNASHEAQVEYVPVPQDQYPAKLAAAVAAGDVPDLYDLDVVFASDVLGEDKDVLADITDHVNGLPYKDDLAPAYIEAYSVGDRIFAVPYHTDASTLFWNKGLFEAAGLDPEKPPTDFAELEEYAAAITALGDGTYGYYFAGACPNCLMYEMLPMIVASGSTLWSEDGTTATFDAPGVKDVLALHKRLWEAGYVDPAAKTDNGSNFLGAFMSGKIGMEGLGAFAIGPIRTDMPDIDFGVGTIPGSGGDSAVFSGGDVIGISSGARNAEGAWEFIEWALSGEVQTELYSGNGELTSRLDLASNEYTADDPQIIAQGGAQAVGFVPLHPRYNELQDLFGKMFTRAVFDGDVDGAIADAQAQAAQIVAE